MPRVDHHLLDFPGIDDLFVTRDFPAKVRYVRIRNLESWDGTTKFGIAEIDLYGDPR